ncbi:MAG: acetyl-CoA carboxylase biotin carboxylase subunit family protein [Porcipelethomonas sp.]
MKRILLLGGSAQQVIAITTAKQLGYYTILCDYLEDNPGQYSADKFYLVSTTDKEAILKVAQDEQIDGVLAYASDPAAPTAAYVAEKLGLPGNPYESVEILCNKDKFRKFLSENGFCTPKAKGYDNIQEAEKDIESGYFNFPVIVKPVDSSGSKGATVLSQSEKIAEAVKSALSFSRSGNIVIEEYIEKKHPYLIGGDIFIHNDEVILWGLMNCHRDNNVNPLVPVGKSYPPKINEDDLEMAKNTLCEMVKRLNIHNGAMNVEFIIDKSDRVFLIDVGPRNGGNMIPDLLGYIFGTDIVKMTIQTAMNEVPELNVGKPELYYATHNLHSPKNGRYNHIEYSADIEKYIFRKCEYKKKGDVVEYFDNAAKALGVIFMKFEAEDLMIDTLNSINSQYYIIMEDT